jgi:hypothetical protein
VEPLLSEFAILVQQTARGAAPARPPEVRRYRSESLRALENRLELLARLSVCKRPWPLDARRRAIALDRLASPGSDRKHVGARASCYSADEAPPAAPAALPSPHDSSRGGDLRSFTFSRPLQRAPTAERNPASLSLSGCQRPSLFLCRRSGICVRSLRDHEGRRTT